MVRIIYVCTYTRVTHTGVLWCTYEYMQYDIRGLSFKNAFHLHSGALSTFLVHESFAKKKVSTRARATHTHTHTHTLLLFFFTLDYLLEYTDCSLLHLLLQSTYSNNVGAEQLQSIHIQDTMLLQGDS